MIFSLYNNLKYCNSFKINNSKNKSKKMMKMMHWMHI